MRRALCWLGLLLLTTSFGWFILLPSPMHPRVAPRPPAAKGEEPFVVVLDAGHGGRDSGAMCGPLMEKDLALDVVLRAELLLRAEGCATVLTRDDDRYLTLAERAAVANHEEHSLFVSVHFNDGERTAASGVETYYATRQSVAPPGLLAWLPFLQRTDPTPLTAQSESLAKFIQAALVERTRAVDRGTKSEQFYVITNVRHPAALVEGGFISNKSDLTNIVTAEYHEQIASAICDGIHRYRDVVGNHQPTLAWAAAPAE